MKKAILVASIILFTAALSFSMPLSAEQVQQLKSAKLAVVDLIQYHQGEINKLVVQRNNIDRKLQMVEKIKAPAPEKVAPKPKQER